MRIALVGLAVLSLALAALMLSGVCLRQDEFTSENTSRSVRTTKVAALPQLDAENLQDLVRHKGQQVSVKGKVHSTHLATSHKVFTLNLGPDWRTCFKVAIFQDAFGKWDGGVAGIKSLYEGQTVTVEGELRMYRDSPEIIVRVPSQIQVMK
jgi:hypothetical protein